MRATIPAALVTTQMLRALGYDQPAALATDLQALMNINLSPGYSLVSTVSGKGFPITIQAKRIACDISRATAESLSDTAIRIE